MTEIVLHRFSNRMPLFMELSRKSYVGPRIFPLAAFLYAVLNAATDVTGDRHEVDNRLFMQVRDMLTQFITDRYYSEPGEFMDMDRSIEVPSGLLRDAYSEIIKGSALLDDVSDQWVGRIVNNYHRFRVVPDVPRNALLVVMR